MVFNRAETPRIKFLVKSIEENRCLSRKFKFFFKIIHIYLALDFGFMKFKSLRARIIMRAISIIQCLFYCATSIMALTNSSNPFVQVWYCYILEYFLYVFVSSFLQCDKSFYDLQNDLLAIDSEMETDSYSNNVELKLMFSLSIVVFLRIMYSYALCYFSNGDIRVLTLILFFNMPPYLSNDIMMIMHTFTYCSVIIRIVNFTNLVKENKKDIVSCEYIYKSMIDSTQESMKTFKAIFVICLFCNMPQIMMAVYKLLAVKQNNNVGEIDLLFITSAGAIIIQALIFMFLPSYYAGKLVSETENLKLILHKILLLETDSLKSRDLKRFIKYIEARPFKFTALKIISIDWTLPVLIINISVTYLIVAIQFTHIY